MASEANPQPPAKLWTNKPPWHDGQVGDTALEAHGKDTWPISRLLRKNQILRREKQPISGLCLAHAASPPHRFKKPLNVSCLHESYRLFSSRRRPVKRPHGLHVHYNRRHTEARRESLSVITTSSHLPEGMRKERSRGDRDRAGEERGKSPLLETPPAPQRLDLGSGGAGNMVEKLVVERVDLGPRSIEADLRRQCNIRAGAELAKVTEELALSFAAESVDETDRKSPPESLRLQPHPKLGVKSRAEVELEARLVLDFGILSMAGKPSQHGKDGCVHEDYHSAGVGV
ncbi:uncharacterized protein BDR25DRAFT_351381 [Lindgomyces ingoldianus]|uniref:Uncharacterized protein n=1 Tax=Lindgomyces ingoldianus TaxID=673940 RepID=A0ACB6R995_9PLEO|nr:uncharacterized protein BDR25DRAFT_351381 [Lindgomyces ingoldianus]KAF2474892.1 hypothetical protein BDR25DRAFT_351381 [Lindgomyces ingoldianus]